MNLDDFYLAHFHEDVGVLAVCKIQDSTAVLGNGGGVQVDLHGDAWIGAGRGNFLYKYRGGLGYCSADSGQVERRQCDPRDNTTWPSGCGDCLRNDDCQPMRTISNTMGTYGLAITPNGDLWQSRMTTGRISSRNGIAFYRDPDSLTDGWTAAFDLPGSGLLGINYGIGTDKFGNAYINTAATNDGLYFASYSPTSGINMRKLIGPGAPADNTYRRGVGIDSSGAIWVADQGNNRIERVVNGSVVDTAGSLPQLDFPYGVSGDSAGYVWAISNGQFGRVIAPACRFQVTGNNWFTVPKNLEVIIPSHETLSGYFGGALAALESEKRPDLSQFAFCSFPSFLSRRLSASSSEASSSEAPSSEASSPKASSSVASKASSSEASSSQRELIFRILQAEIEAEKEKQKTIEAKRERDRERDEARLKMIELEKARRDFFFFISVTISVLLAAIIGTMVALL